MGNGKGMMITLETYKDKDSAMKRFDQNKKMIEKRRKAEKRSFPIGYLSEPIRSLQKEWK